MTSTNGQNIDLSILLLKDVAKYLHEEISKHRKTIHNKKKKKKDFNFKHSIRKYGHGYARLHINLWSQDNKSYRSNAGMTVAYSGLTPNLLCITIYSRGMGVPEIDVGLDNPNAYESILKELIKLLDWRG